MNVMVLAIIWMCPRMAGPRRTEVRQLKLEAVISTGIMHVDSRRREPQNATDSPRGLSEMRW